MPGICAAEGTGGGCVKRADKQDDNKTRAGQIPVGEACHTEGPAAILVHQIMITLSQGRDH